MYHEDRHVPLNSFSVFAIDYFLEFIRKWKKIAICPHLGDSIGKIWESNNLNLALNLIKKQAPPQSFLGFYEIYICRFILLFWCSMFGVSLVTQLKNKYFTTALLLHSQVLHNDHLKFTVFSLNTHVWRESINFDNA